MTQALLVLHGPDLLRLGRGRLSAEPTLDALDAALDFAAAAAGITVRCARGSEVELAAALDAAAGWATHVLVSPGALAPVAWQLRAALAFSGLPYAEIFVAAMPGSDEHRQRSVLENAAAVRRRGSANTVYAEAAERLLGVRFAAVPPDLAAKAAAAAPVKADEPPRPRANETLPPPVATLPPRPAETLPPPIAKSELGRGTRQTLVEAKPPSTKTLGRKSQPPTRSTKTLGRRQTEPEPEMSRHVSRAQVRQHLSDRLAGKISAAELATWGRDQWLTVERGGPTEAGQRELLHEVLQRLALSSTAGVALSDPELLDLMARMG